MSVYKYPLYKILIDPEAKKTQGLKVGDVVRRQYFDYPNLYYSLMIVTDTGVEQVAGKDSSYFVGALIEGDEPQSGQILDFVRITNLFDSDRSGALYLTASDSEAPYMDVIDGLAFENSLSFPCMTGGSPEVPDRNKYAVTSSDYATITYTPSYEDASRIIRISRKKRGVSGSDSIILKQPLDGLVGHPQRIVISYKIRASHAIDNIPISLGYVDNSQIDGSDMINVTTDWTYKLHLINIDYPKSYPRCFSINLNAMLTVISRWCEIADFNIVLQSDISTFADATKARIGKVSGIVDPVFGVLEGYGAYFQNLYATRNVNIAGTLTAGDENGFASTFYVGRIHKNVLLNSIDCKFVDDAIIPVAEKSPAGIGCCWRVDQSAGLIVQDGIWRKEHIDSLYCFSLWMKGEPDTIVTIRQDDYHVADIRIDSEDWKRYSISFRIQDAQSQYMIIGLSCISDIFMITSAQLESGTTPSQYQPTDGTLSYVEDYGAWFNKGGIGGTIQNPLLRLNEDGSISSRDSSFVIYPDGTGHFASGRFRWEKDKIILQDVTIRWEALDEESRESLMARYVSLSGANVFHYSDNDTVVEPGEIQIQACEHNFVSTTRKWHYLSSGQVWEELSDKTSYLNVRPNGIYWEGRNVLQVRYTAVYKEIEYTNIFTVYKQRDGKSSYSVRLSRSSYLLSTDKDGKVHADTSILTTVSALKGDLALTPVIGTLPSLSGCSLSKSGAVITIIFRAGTTLADNGIIDIPVTVEGKSFHLSFSYAKAKAGVSGVDANLLDWVSDWNTNKTVIDSGSLITPKIFAGTKNSNGTLTGIALGKFQLSTMNASGGVISELINGVYGFKDGYKTFFVDSTGSAQLGRGSQFIKYNSATGKIEFGSDVSLNWTSAIATAKSETLTTAATDAQVKANQAKVDAISIAATDASTKATGAKNAAITAAASDATAKADSARAEAISTASKDAQTKANSAKADAIATAAADATTKANNAKAAAIDAVKADIADAKKAGVDARAVADALTKTANDEKWATKLTYIDANGIFTGTLSAGTVNAIRINASQITAGTIDVSRLNVDALKASLITAANIDALTLNVVRGKIGGWTVDSDSIYRGSRNNTAGAYTSASGSITIGSNGIRGFKWRLDSTGSGAIAGGNISWDVSGNVTFSSSVSLLWTNAANSALASAKTYADTLKTEAINQAKTETSNQVGAIKLGGRNLLRNSGLWRTAGWNNGVTSNGGGYTIDASVTYRGVSTIATLVGTGLSHPWIKLDTGVEYTYSAMVLCNETISGNGNTPLHYHAGLNNVSQGKIAVTHYDTSVTANVWKQIYIVFKLTGNGNSFLPFFYRGANGSTKYWVAHMKLERGNKPTDWSPAPEDMHYLGTYINLNGIYTGTLTASQINVSGIDASKITVGTLSADRIAAGSISSSKLNADEVKANIINTSYINGLSCTFTKGTIGGLTISANSIYHSLDGRCFILKSTAGDSPLGSNRGHRGLTMYNDDAAVTAGRVKIVQIGALADKDTTQTYSSETNYGIRIALKGGKDLFRVDQNCAIIAGWNIDGDSIFSGTKNNTAGVYTSASGHITIGSAGIRGFKWRLDSTGAGAIAGGNISWDAAGTVTFSPAVSLNWTNAIDAAKSTNYGYRYYKRIVINGEENKYYPVIIKGGDQTVKRDIFIRRAYSEQAPSSWNTATHMGGLSLLIKANFGGWGGTNYSWDIYELSEIYCNMFASAQLLGNSMHFGVFLRGGGTTGAVYHLYSDQNLEALSYSPSPIPQVAPQICYNQDLYWKSGASELYAPAARTLTDAVKEEIRRRRFIALSQERDTYLTSHPLTYIGATGIYTGTLTAEQVNAVSINADSIKAGTLSADRIAAGSITAAKLNVASVQASIVTAAAVNGLTCAFVRGTIGGFTIDSGSMTVGSVGAGGATPLQIRSSASGSGYYYTGTYKPFGITLTWHQSNNAGHLVFGQVAASGNSIRSGFIGIQMMAWDNTEYFCLSTNYTKSGSKEVYNRIAGWAFDSDSLYRGAKNNASGAYTSASEGITIGSNGIRGFKWRFDSTGAGAIAGGNISWDASGTVTFASSVSLNWTNAANSALSSAKTYADTKKTEAISAAATDATTKAEAAKELALAMAFGKMLYRDPTFINGNNSINIYNNLGNGMVTITRTSDSSAPNDNKVSLVITNTGAASPYCGGFNFSTGTTARRVLIARIVANIPVGRAISYHSNSIGNGGSQKWLTSTAGTGDWAEYICKIVCGTSGTFSSTCFFALTGGVGTASAPIQWKVAYATVFDVQSTERYMTTIDANGIYTGTVRAGQILVDSALVVGGSTYNGSVSVRDASNVVKVTLDRTGITAVGGTIGGWVIASSQISKNGIILGADGSITNGTKWKLNYDGSGQFANGNITWNTAGSVTMTGTINATAGNIGGFEISYGRIGSVASSTGSGGGLALYNDFFRVGSSISYAMFGDDTFPATAGGSFKTTGRLTNTRYDSYYTNIGLYLDVKNARRNFGIHSNAAIMGASLISNKIKTISFGSGSYSIDFSQHHIFYVYATTTCNVNLPTESSVAEMFGLSYLPSDFGYMFTFIYNYNWANKITLLNVRNHNGDLQNYTLVKGDSVTLLCAKYPSFHYQVVNHTS